MALKSNVAEGTLNFCGTDLETNKSMLLWQIEYLQEVLILSIAP